MDWKDYEEIASALNRLYPDKSPGMPDSELIEKVIALPGFSGEKQLPGKTYLSFIKYRWISIKSGSYEYGDPRENCP
jgi:FeS assembly protein IscX